ncbi:MAG TPA: SLBB domain-containing protein [Gemmatimonadales bacterium]|jgi:protein involved in polysaccharide export with SLBB domain|nr:SLBB domain-containing protein [Gemmatimonadales bacterium]
MRYIRALLAVPALLVVLLPVIGRAQGSGDDTARRLLATRTELEARLNVLRDMARTSRPDWLLAESTVVRMRLDQGDFRVGDRVLLTVEDPAPVRGAADRAGVKSEEQQLSDTFTVGAGQELLLPVVGTVSLKGALRSELQPIVAREIAGFIRDPVVHARALLSVGVTGEVARPGYYAVPGDAVVAMLLTAAGGPTKDAQMNKLKLDRAGKTLWEGNEFRRAIAEGRTLEDLRVQAGDQLIVPTNKHSDLFSPIRFVAVLLSIPVTIYTLTHLK